MGQAPATAGLLEALKAWQADRVRVGRAERPVPCRQTGFQKEGRPGIRQISTPCGPHLALLVHAACVLSALQPLSPSLGWFSFHKSCEAAGNRESAHGFFCGPHCCFPVSIPQSKCVGPGRLELWRISDFGKCSDFTSWAPCYENATSKGLCHCNEKAIASLRGWHRAGTLAF